MPIEIKSNQINSYHWLAFKTGEKVNGQDVYFVSISGIAIPNFKGDSGNWKREKLIIEAPWPSQKISTPVAPSDKVRPLFQLKNWVVFSSLNSIYNDKGAVNSGHAVDSFKLSSSLVNGDFITIESDIAVSDNDAILFRVGYKVDFLACFDDWGGNILI